MAVVKAKIVKKVPTCPTCGYTYSADDNWEDYGVEEDGYFFKFLCPTCTSKKKKLYVVYSTDIDFRLKE